jgi:pimeloyl-ACP methyl ester carboxylesterase
MELLSVKLLGKTGPHLILLHGWGNSHFNLLPLGTLLSKSYQVHLIDLPGFGASSPPPSHFGYQDFAKTILAYCERTGITRAAVLGHSFGGKVAVGMSEICPAKIERLILIGSSGIPSQMSVKKLGLKLVAKGMKFFDALFHQTTFQTYFAPRFGSKDWKEAGAMRPILVRSIQEDLSESFKKIQCPTLLIWGAQDLETPLWMGKKISQLISKSQLIVYPQAGHHPFEDTGAHLAARHILSFLKEVPS